MIYIPIFQSIPDFMSYSVYLLSCTMMATKAILVRRNELFIADMILFSRLRKSLSHTWASICRRLIRPGFGIQIICVCILLFCLGQIVRHIGIKLRFDCDICIFFLVKIALITTKFVILIVLLNLCGGFVLLCEKHPNVLKPSPKYSEKLWFQLKKLKNLF